METFAGIFAWEANLERSRREKSMADQAWPIIPSQATEAIRRSISRFPFLPLFVLHQLESEFDQSVSRRWDSRSRAHVVHDSWKKSSSLLLERRKKEEKSLRRKRERERRETLRADYTVGQCEKYYPLISLRTPCRFHSAKKLTTTGRRFSTTCLRRLSAERATEVNVPQEVAEPRFPLPTRGESKRSTALDTFANLD